MLAVLDYTASDTPIVARTGTGSLMRRFTLPIELSGVTVTINGVACGLRSVAGRRIEFVVPPAFSSELTGTVMPLVINNNGIVLRSNVTIVPTRPDIFINGSNPGPGGRARLFNVTNTVQTTEPLVIRTIRRKSNVLVPSRIRLFLTGVEGVVPSVVSIRIRDVVIAAANIRTSAILVEPGVYSIDFDLPSTVERFGDQPIVVTVTVSGTLFSSRLDDTSSRVFIL
jgi:uncharacterized protein (TIGR03437 family)